MYPKLQVGQNFPPRTHAKKKKFRSLKFRDKETGAVVLHKAVVGICNGLRELDKFFLKGEIEILDSREHVNQSEFDKQEQEFRVNR